MVTERARIGLWPTLRPKNVRIASIYVLKARDKGPPPKLVNDLLAFQTLQEPLNLGCSQLMFHSPQAGLLGEAHVRTARCGISGSAGPKRSRTLTLEIRIPRCLFHLASRAVSPLRLSCRSKQDQTGCVSSCRRAVFALFDFGAFCLDDRTLAFCQLKGGVSLKPRKVELLAGQLKATEPMSFSSGATQWFSFARAEVAIWSRIEPPFSGQTSGKARG